MLSHPLCMESQVNEHHTPRKTIDIGEVAFQLGTSRNFVYAKLKSGEIAGAADAGWCHLMWLIVC